ncbi:YceI family protein [Nitrogeniibacter mangrovi]|uniref:YceI family protein n=1 Tax=Nitrogeniibacter mangrovi TaxID=2016596 RepID=A0A6C1B6V5_9RHOO|nr:YceI family protein [Nitrogeniibacter mangrovi]QID17984.1 YceI family protein [Nitrogeniibacter mangrovi]
MRMMLASIAAAALSALPCAATAQTFGAVDPDASTLTFSYSQMGVSLDGQFPKFDAAVRYDPTHPDTASTRLQVPLASIDTGSAEGDDEVQGKDWFDTGTHPMARFESTTVKATGPGRLEVTGTLSIKGKERPITVPVSVATDAGHAVFDGHFTINRTDFGIGAGMWAADDVVAHDVTISFHLVTRPLAP